VVKAAKLSVMCINFTPLNTFRGARENPKKYGANAPQLHPIRCSIDFYVMLCNEQAKIPKIRRKRATVAHYSMLYRLLCNAMQRAREKSKKYGANAPQLHHISCAPAWGAVPDQGSKGKIKKIRRKRATVAPYLSL
jgi:hypothetical protein